ncbi:ABC transporter substrate-binding protein [Salinisphaera hydrothermalis]|uniref:Putrescine-binding periplasmic protein n=1 Tax=Salinisphaera hydrothermalis (strain C41B8) TaxID=1304275 RepID=A0A084IM40_SALHC|nr:spermidine/putrescine ABC transporter substrate-binding protein [Salinisphaera hydrothermalis]KEZ77774.1 extracellular solute-binding protein [Salinisphaera hydrothermalis C41B8]
MTTGIGRFGLKRLLPAALLLLAGVSGAQAAPYGDKLMLFNWSDYISPKLIQAFEDKYHVKVVQNFYESNPEMFAKLRAGGDAQYDVIVASNYYIPRLIESGLIQPLDKSEIPNYSNLMARFQKPSYDPTGKYTAAYQWGDTGIVYNTEKLGQQPNSWSILFDPKANPKYPFALGNDAQVMTGAACAYQGHGYACQGRDNWKQAAQLLLKTKKRSNFSGFVDGTPVLRQLARGSVAAGVSFNGDYLQDKANNPQAYKNLKFVVPKEGAELWVDTMAIPDKAPHAKLANKFINFILDGKNGATLSNFTWYASPNKAATPYLKPALRKPPSQPTAEQMKHLHYTPALKGDSLQFVQQLWGEVQSR